jgi:hypothetical protein
MIVSSEKEIVTEAGPFFNPKFSHQVRFSNKLLLKILGAGGS